MFKILISFMLRTSFLFLSFALNAESETRSLGTYNFGLSGRSSSEQITLLDQIGFSGLYLKLNSPKDLDLYRSYFEGSMDVARDFTIRDVYYPYRSKEKWAKQDYWKTVIDEISATPARFSFIPWDLPKPDLNGKVMQIVEYAQSKGVEVELYPHVGSNIVDAEQAAEIIQTLGYPKNLKLSFHYCHELRAGNADRIQEAFVKVSPLVSLVTISGADQPETNEDGTPKPWRHYIRPLRDSAFDFTQLLDAIRSSKWNGPIYLHTWRIKDIPTEEHLNESMEIWKALQKTTEHEPK